MAIQLKKPPEDSPTEADASAAGKASESPAATPAASAPQTPPPGGQPPSSGGQPPSNGQPPAKLTAAQRVAAAKAAAEMMPPKRNLFMRWLHYFLESRKTRPRFFYTSLGLIFGLPIVAYLTTLLVYALYEDWLLKSAGKALADYQYQSAEEYYNRYLERQPADREALYQLAKVHIYTNQYNKAEPVLASLSMSDRDPKPEMFFYRALAAVKQNNQTEVLELLDRVFDLDDSYFPAHYLYNLAFMFIEPNFSLVEGKFTDMSVQVLDMDMDTDIALGYSEEMHHTRRVFFHRFPTQFRRTVPLPFTELEERAPINESVNLNLSPEGFNNAYYLPMHDSRLLSQRLSAKEGVILMRAVAALMAEDPGAAQIHLDLLEGSESLFYYYMKGYLAVLNDDYETAAKFYGSALQTRGDTADGIVLYANAQWVLSGGAKPTSRDINDYEKILSLEKGNVIAINNLAFLQAYRGDLEKARQLLESSEGVGSLNKYITTNLALLKIHRDNLKKAVLELKALSSSYPDLPIIIDALLRVLKLQGKNAEAIALLKRWRKQNPDRDTPEVAMEIARLYRDRNQPLLVSAELSDAAAKFPDNRDITAELLLEYAGQNRASSFREVLALVKDDEDFLKDPRVLVAKAYITKDSNARRTLFEEAVTNADTIDKKNKVLTSWARWLLDNKEAAAVKAVLARAEEVNTEQLPPPLQAALMRLEALGKRGDAERAAALQAAETFISGHPRLEIATLLDIAWVFIHLGESERAIDLVSELSYSTSGVVNVLDALRAAYINIGETESVETIDRRLELIQKGAEDAEDDSDKILEDVDAIIGEGAGGKIIQRLNKALRENNYQTAIDTYTKIIELGIKMEPPALTYQNRGALYIQISEYGLAVKDFQKALSFSEELNKKQLRSILYNYGYALLQLGKYPKSLEILERAVDVAPKDVEVLSLYALALEKSHSYESLVKIYRKIIALSPGRIDIYRSLSRAYQLLRRSDDAIGALKKALEIEPTNREIHRSLAEMYILTGESDKAQEHLDIIKSL